MIVLLVGEKRFIIDTEQKNFNSDYGKIDLTKIKKYGQKIKSSSGHTFKILKPSFPDLLKKARRGPQVITPKDAGQIITLTGVESEWKCLDAGGGSGFLTMMLANIAKPGIITAYERNKDFADNIKKNVKLFGLENVKVKNKDILKGFNEKKLDLITLDMIYAEKMVKKCHEALNIGGYLCIYSPHIEQQIACRKVLEKLDMEIKTLETIQRNWKIDTRGYSHPKHTQLVHTGFLTVARKF